KHYNPQNAILVIGGNFDQTKIKQQIEKWYGDIPPGKKYVRNIDPEPPQIAERRLEITRSVPSNAIYMAFKVRDRKSEDHYLGDLISDILSGGKSARLYQNLVKERKLFSQVNAYISSGFESGLFVIAGFMHNNISHAVAERAIWEELLQLQTQSLSAAELQKVKNKFKTAKAFQNQSILNRVMNISQLAIIDHLAELKTEDEIYEAINLKSIQEFCKKYFSKTNANILTVKADQ
ncbi:MAG: M16 family metallopeptidase, partial [Crocinitomicaceae bacterium]